MIKENVRKEICLLLILTIIASLAFDRTVYAATSDPSIQGDEITAEATVSADPDTTVASENNSSNEANPNDP